MKNPFTALCASVTGLLWRVVAYVATRGPVWRYLLARAQKTPYTPITGSDGQKIYMDRWWLFNRYDQGGPRFASLPSIRIHHILLPDDDRHPHDHPWDARTMVGPGWYEEVGELTKDEKARHARTGLPAPNGTWDLRKRGYTGPIKFGQYHRILNVSPGGVYTIFLTWGYEESWGFLVNGKKVHYKHYLQMRDYFRMKVKHDHPELLDEKEINARVARWLEEHFVELVWDDPPAN